MQIDHYDILEPEVLFSNEEAIIQGLNGIYDLFYPEWSAGTDVQKSWNIKPQLAFSNHPTLDAQASGWDAEFTRHAWRPDKDMFEDSWKQCYKVIDRTNRFLVNLSNVEDDIFEEADTREIIIAQTRAIRGFFYSYLAQNFGRLPMLLEGDTYMDSPYKPRAESVEETWDLIIEDFTYAERILDWKPWKGEYGRITKGMVKNYLAQAYMYNQQFADAARELKSIIDSGVYGLEECYALIHREGYYWGKESVWEIGYPRFSNLNWGADGVHDALWWPAYLTASPDLDGWGSLFISYEFCESFEPGDRRLEYSVVQRGQRHPYTGEMITDDQFRTADNMPNNYSLKLWKHRPGSEEVVFNPQSAIWVRYAAVLLNYAECLFETGGDGWSYIQQIRNRAWGGLEHTISQPADFPFDLKVEPVQAPDAREFYTRYRSEKGYTSDAWKVALTIERRHEFMAEYSFWYDLTRSGMAKEFLDCEYPIGKGITNRQFEYQSYRELYPIPYLEIITNREIGPENQNPGY
ncbi:MAG: RagB/SusD family nutrient uptake outer membrane protein [Tannerellaceae bacterium]|nr:RagB/SusD family nutrient uptake outer membrane protein [Tannerellaceae bacterium]